MRMTEEEYQNLINRRTEAIKDIASSLNIPAPRNVRKLEEETIPTAAFPMAIVKDKAKHGKPNKTEMAYSYRLQMEFPGCNPLFEGITLRLRSGHKYTPDFVVQVGGRVICIEVKNSAYKHASYGRSRLAYDCARNEWPMFQFRWVEKTTDGWKEK